MNLDKYIKFTKANINRLFIFHKSLFFIQCGLKQGVHFCLHNQSRAIIARQRMRAQEKNKLANILNAHMCN